MARRALRDVSFTVAKGEVATLLGANGSGKTTTMRILAGYLQGTSGHMHVAGYDVASQSMAARRQVGYLPETTPVHTDMTVADDLVHNVCACAEPHDDLDLIDASDQFGKLDVALAVRSETLLSPSHQALIKALSNGPDAAHHTRA